MQLSLILYLLLATMDVDDASLRKLFWMQGNFCVHYQWEIILSAVVCCIVLIRYAGLTSISDAAYSALDSQPVSNCNKLIPATLLYYFVGHQCDNCFSCKCSGCYSD